jgi:hypothetical protein
MSEMVSLTSWSQETIAFLLGSCDAFQHAFKVQWYSIAEIDSNRLQGLCDHGQRKVAWRRTCWDGRPFSQDGALSGRFVSRGFVDLVLKGEASRLHEHVPCLIPFPLVQVPALIAAELPRA